MGNYDVSSEESDRIKILKFLAIVFVVFFHSSIEIVNFSSGTEILNLPNWLQLIEDGISQVIARCGVPIFFLISSVLFFKTERKYISVLKNKAITLLIPYLIWNTFWIIVFVILQNLSFTEIYFSGSFKPMLQLSFPEWLGVYGIGQQYPHDFPLWFIRDLMVVILLFPVVKVIVSKFPKLVLTLVLVMTLVPIDFPFKTALIWFVAGACLVELQLHMGDLDKIPMWIFNLVYLALGFCTLFVNYMKVIDIFILFSILFWIRATKKIYEYITVRKFFLSISKWTFMIYVFHELTLSSIRKVCFRMLPTNPLFLFLDYICIPVFVIFLCIIIGHFMEKLFPKLYKISTGAR